MTPCDLYLTLPADFDAAQMRLHLPRLLAHPRVTALRLPSERAVGRDVFSEIVTLARACDVATIAPVETAAAAKSAVMMGSDGLHVKNVAALDGLRTLAGDDIQLGCLCETRDNAMLAGELGADYIAFPAAQSELVPWWTAVMELPAVAEDILSPEKARLAQESGADFLAIPLNLTEDDAIRLDLIVRSTEP